MVTAGGQPGHGALDAALDIFRPGTGFYEQFLDTRQWPEFMRAGREAMLATLRQHAPRLAA